MQLLSAEHAHLTHSSQLVRLDIGVDKWGQCMMLASAQMPRNGINTWCYAVFITYQYISYFVTPMKHALYRPDLYSALIKS